MSRRSHGPVPCLGVQVALLEAAMAAHFLRRFDPGHAAWLDWLLILAGAMLALLFWPVTHP